jgi:hypothetical protein
MRPPNPKRRLPQSNHPLARRIILLAQLIAILCPHKDIPSDRPGTRMVPAQVLSDGVVGGLPAAHVLVAQVAADIVEGAGVGGVEEAGKGEGLGGGQVVGPAGLALLGSEFDGGLEGGRAGLDGEHLACRVLAYHGSRRRQLMYGRAHTEPRAGRDGEQLCWQVCWALAVGLVGVVGHVVLCERCVWLLTLSLVSMQRRVFVWLLGAEKNQNKVGVRVTMHAQVIVPHTPPIKSRSHPLFNGIRKLVLKASDRL